MRTGLRGGSILGLVLWALLIPGVVRAQIHTVVFGVEAQGASDAATLTLAVEAATGASGRQPSHDPMLDSAPADSVLLQYAGTRADAIGLVLRTRLVEGRVAIEATAGREIVVRRFQLVSADAVPTAARDTARLAIDALVDILTNGAERAAGPPRVAIVVDDRSLRDSVTPGLEALASQQGAIVVPAPMVAAARAFLPTTGDAGANTVRLRETLDVDRLWLVSADASGTHLYAIDASGPQTRDVPAGAMPSDVATAAAALPAPTRRAPLRVAAPLASAGVGVGVAAAQPGATPVAGAAEAAPAHQTLASTGEDYTFLRVSQLLLGFAVGFGQEGGALFGGMVSGNLALGAIQNRPGLAIPFNLQLNGTIVTRSSGGASFTALPLLSAGLGIGIQTDPFWIQFYGGGGFFGALVSSDGAGTDYSANFVGVVGLRFGFPLANYTLMHDPDLVGICGGLDIHFNDNAWFGVGTIGVCL